MDDVVVVGIGVRFPGRADTTDGLWSVLAKGESQWSEFPDSRLNIQGFYHPSRNRQGSIPFQGAHLLRHNVAKFDASFFAITVEEAKAVDPQQRMLLEVTYEALENAGIRKEDIDGSPTSVFVGSFVKDYEQVCLRDPDDSPQYAATGNGIALMANRISYAFNLRGPSETVDTGCSGSLVAVHNAIQSLQRNESSLAIAAGAGLLLTPATMMPMTALNFLSPDGKCFTFDKRANGYGRGEGIGVLILKRLSHALRDNDTIRAVIRGSSKNQDGRTLGITLPSAEAQAENIRLAYGSAGLTYDQTGFVECHGTGTQAGDWRELKAISQTISLGRTATTPVVAGSLKPNIGHLEGAAGVAGLIKGVLVLERGQIPPQTNYEQPNPDIDLQKWHLQIPRSLMEWPLPGVRRVSVNCFGFGGSNVHLIMDDASSYMVCRGLAGHHNTRATKRSSHESADLLSSNTRLANKIPFCFSGQDKAALKRIIESHVSYLNDNIDSNVQPDFLRDYAYTLACRRSTFSWRAHVLCDSSAELAASLSNIDESSFVRTSMPRNRICFVFGGQGSQWAGMGRDLCQFHVFKAALVAASDYLQVHLRSPFILIDEMLQSSGDSALSRPDIAQPAITALQIALVDLLRFVSVIPSCVIGHSSGEIAAAYASGSISRETAWNIAYWRGFYAAAIPFLAPEVKGGMMAVGLSQEEMQAMLDVKQTLNQHKLQIACVNSPMSVTVSGERSCIEALALDLTHMGIFHRVLAVNVAYHSDHMRLVSRPYEWTLQDVKMTHSPSGIKMISTVTGEEVHGTDLNGTYWAQNMVSQVRYATALSAMAALPPSERVEMIVEVSPRSQLQSPTLDTLAMTDTPTALRFLSATEKGYLNSQSLFKLIATLWNLGVPVNFLGLLKKTEADPIPRCLVDLPTYPWNHSTSYWHESHLSSNIRFRRHGREDIIGALTADSTPFEPRWRGFLRVFENPWLQDHKIQKTIIYPAAGMIAMVLEAAKQLSEGDPRVTGFEIKRMQIERAIIVPESAHGVEVVLSVRRRSLDLDDGSERGDDFAIYSKQFNAPWQRHAIGSFRICIRESEWEGDFHSCREQHKLAQASCTTSVVPRELYELLDNIGLNYGSTFRNIKELRREDSCVVSRVRVSDTRSKMPEKFEYPHLIHPATLDSMFQTLFAIEVRPMVPVAIETIFVSSNVAECKEEDFVGLSTASRRGIHRASADISMSRGQKDSSHIIIKGLELARITADNSTDSTYVSSNSHLATEIVWKEDICFTSPETIPELLDLLCHKTPSLSILQLSDDVDIMRAILKVVAPRSLPTARLSRYTLARSEECPTVGGCSQLAADWDLESFVETLDLTDLVSEGAFDLILAPGNYSVTADRLQAYLSGGGLLTYWARGLTPSGAETTSLNIHRHHITFPLAASCRLVFIVPDRHSSTMVSLVKMLERRTKTMFPGCTTSCITFAELGENCSAASLSVFVSLLDLHDKQPFSSYDWNSQSFQIFHKMQSQVKRLLWITHGAHRKPTNPRGALIIGLIRTLISEDPLKRYVTLDLGSRTHLLDDRVADIISTILANSFFSGATVSCPDAEYAEEEGRVYVPRLMPITTLNDQIAPNLASQSYATMTFEVDSVEPLAAKQRLEHVVPSVTTDSPGSYFTRSDIPELGDHKIEVEFQSATLTPDDAEILSGKSRRSDLGLDVRGRIRRVGSLVPASFCIGDEVTGLTLHGGLKTLLHLDHRLSRSAPTAFVPSLYLAAYYALIHVGKARQGASVLILGAASAYGLSAVLLAQRLGLDIFAASYGENVDEQRDTLIRVGVLPDRILDGNSPAFIHSMNETLDSNGVHVVYNTTGDLSEACFRCAKPYGSVVQLAVGGSRQSPRPIASNTVYTTFDIYSLVADNPALTEELVDRVLSELGGEEGGDALPDICTSTWTTAEVDKALQHISKDPSYGCARITCSHEVPQVVRARLEPAIKPLQSAISEEGTYLIVGGALGLGASITQLLLSKGARHLAFISRSGNTSAASQSALARLQEGGAEIKAFATDIGDASELQVTIDAIKESMPTVCGVFQCAAVIQDAVFDNMTFADWEAAIRPKAHGSWNLVESISAAGLDPFFIFLASSAGVIGNRGQANYAAGNCFEDAMARMLQLQGKHAVSIDLGPVLGAGMLADNEEILDMLRASGFYSISHDDFLKVMSHAMTGEIVKGQPMPAQVTLGVGTGGIIRQNQPADPYWTRTAIFSYLNLIDVPPPSLGTGGRVTAIDLRTRLRSAPTATAAGELISLGIREMLAKAMTMLPEEIDLEKPPNAYGVDSLVAIGLRNWVQGNCGVEVSLFEVLSDQTVADMGTMIAKRGDYGVATGDA